MQFQLVVGLPNVTIDQAMLQMTLWSIWSAPLIMSNDLRKLKPEFKKVLLNRDVIAVDQDQMGIMGKLVKKSKSVGIYLKPVTPVQGWKTSYALAVVNKNELEVKFEEITFSAPIQHHLDPYMFLQSACPLTTAFQRLPPHPVAQTCVVAHVQSR
ncbi:unnamed protein product [Cylicostephanus goldi]|uniref:Alpha-galactosidase n=1 Tax=Cylicostephanus goldi TaxID=71465 RepID=A0A3P7PVX1_CYLGO|nr:unnamed protein product [Cylicostephanus goldi]